MVIEGALESTVTNITQWNDYGESHYVGPLNSPHIDDGNSKWVNDMYVSAYLRPGNTRETLLMIMIGPMMVFYRWPNHILRRSSRATKL